MRDALVIFRREFKSYFLSPIAYVFGALFLGVQIYLGTTGTMVHGRGATMFVFFTILPWVLLFFVPALTMRLWAEERKLGTLELLMTFPVTVASLIAGKFFAALLFLVLVLMLTLGVPWTLAMYGDLDWGPVFGAYIGAVFMASAYLSVGMFFSSLTRDQIVALLMALVTLLLLFIVGMPAMRIYMDVWAPSWALDLLGAVSPYRYFGSIARGVLDTRDFVYYGAFCTFFLWLNGLVLKARRVNG